MRWLFLFWTLPLLAQSTIVRADRVLYKGGLVTLQGSVHVEHEMGELFAKRALLTRDEEKQTRLDFPWVNVDGEVRFVLKEGRELICNHASCDYILKKAYVKGGLHYRDAHGELFADEGLIDYVEEEGKLKPTHVHLLGSIQMLNSKKAQYALCESVDYFPDEEKMILSSDKRVLFFDEKHAMQLSAREVHAKRDEMKQESIQGIGDVHFVFGAEELARLQDSFGFK